MRLHLSTGLAALTAAALLTGLSATPSLATAAKTWSVTPGGAVTAKTKQVTMTDQSTKMAFTCQSSTLSTTFKAGSGLPGNHLASISHGSFTCVEGPSGIILKVRPKDLPWIFTATSYDASSGVVTGTIGHIEIAFSATGCSLVTDGTSGGASDGQVRVTYTDSSGVLKILPTGGNLHVWDVEGCLGFWVNGDPMGISASYKTSPKQTITSP
jgi:hypothetical protein